MSEYRTSFRGANLRRANLEGADLRGADLGGVDLREANLRGANLAGALMQNADLRGACLDRAVLAGTDLRGAQLSSPDAVSTSLVENAVYAPDTSRAESSPLRTAPYSAEAIRSGPFDDEKNATPHAPSYIFRKEQGDYWYLRFGTEEARVSDRKGLVYIHYLLQHQKEWISGIELLALTDPDAVLHEQQRTREMRQSLLTAQADARSSLRFVHQQEKHLSGEELQRATAFYNEELAELHQKVRSLRKNLYVRVTNNFERTFTALETAFPVLAEHLRQRITYRNGDWLYLPQEQEEVRWELFYSA